ncbi:MAG: hypothetical protein D6785_15685, partial [Planctomycetota bacterium]
VSPCLARDRGGRFYMVWQDSSNGKDEIYFAKSTDQGKTWSPPVDISSTSGNSEKPMILAGDNGVLSVVWQEEVSGSWEIYYARSTTGGDSWSTPVNLSQNAGISYTPSLTQIGNTVYAAWADNTSGTWEIYWSKSVDGGITWTTPASPFNTGTASLYPCLAADSQGSLHLVWQEDLSGNREIYYARSSDGGASWTSPVNLSNTSEDSWLPRLAVGGQDKLCLVWQEYENTNSEVYYLESTDRGLSWKGMTNVSNSAGNSESPVVAVDKRGYPHVAWADDSSGNWEIIYTRWQQPVDLLSQDFQSAPVPGLPSGWTAPNGGWIAETGTRIGASSTYAIASGNGSNWDLESPPIDCSYAASVFLKFNQNFTATTTPGASQSVKVDVGVWNESLGQWVWNPIPPLSGSGTPVYQYDQS